jgi:hypothetical protein
LTEKDDDDDDDKDLATRRAKQGVLSFGTARGVAKDPHACDALLVFSSPFGRSPKHYTISSHTVISLTSQVQHSNLHILATTPCLIAPERRVDYSQKEKEKKSIKS